MKYLFSDVTMEAVTHFWNSRPCNIRHSNKPQGTLEYFEEVEKKKYLVEPHILDFADFSSVEGKDVLEIGCGIGTAAVGFARAKASSVTAVDVSSESLKLAKVRAELYGLKNIEYHLGNAEVLRSFLPLKEYDVIYSFGVIHHSVHPHMIVRELYHYAKPGGTLKVMVYHRFSWKTFWIFVCYGRGRFWRWSEIVAKYSEAQTGCPITYTFSKKEAKELIENAGFTVKKIYVDHVFPYKISEYVKHNLVKVWYFRVLPAKVFRWFEKVFGWHLCIEATK